MKLTMTIYKRKITNNDYRNGKSTSSNHKQVNKLRTIAQL